MPRVTVVCSALPALLALGGLLLSLLALVGPAQAITSGYLCTGYTAARTPATRTPATRAEQQPDVLADVLRPQLHQLRGLPDDQGRHAQRPALVGQRQRHNWGLAMRNITDQQPRVGAVAWWTRNVPGAGSGGHVAYVERVISPTEIVISEDSWGGDFHWRKLIARATGWPSGFIHFVDKAIDNTRQPTVAGTPQVGVAAHRDAGRRGSPWRPSTYQWLANGAPIAGATKATYVPTADPARPHGRRTGHRDARRASRRAASPCRPRLRSRRACSPASRRRWSPATRSSTGR